MRSEECLNARKEINNQCFNGGDTGHTQGSTQASTNLENCRKIHKDRGC
jgi:Novel toxin 16